MGEESVRRVESSDVRNCVRTKKKRSHPSAMSVSGWRWHGLRADTAVSRMSFDCGVESGSTHQVVTE